MRSNLIAAVLTAVIIPTAIRADNVDEYIRKEMHHWRIPGLAVAIVRGSKVRTQGYGLADVEAGTGVSAETVFQIGSLTKQFTAAAVMSLVEDSKINLDDKIGAYLNSLPAAYEGVTVRQLLTHTTGIKDYAEQSAFDAFRRLDHRPEDLLNLIANEPLDFPSGTRFKYSNTNYLLLGMLIQQLTKESYGEFLTQRLFRPLGMSQTTVNNSAEIISHRARGYTRIPGYTQNAVYFSPTNAFGAGDVVSSIGDLVKWSEVLSTRKFLKHESYTAMWTPASSQTGAVAYGFGWEIKEEGGHRLIAHGGNITGFSSAALYFPDEKLTIILLTNRGNLDAEKIALGLAGELDSAFLKREPLPVNDTDPETTARLKRIFIGMLAGQMGPEDFSDKLNRELGPLIRRGQAESKARAADFGRLERFELMESRTTSQGKKLQYRAFFEYQMRCRVYVSIDSYGKITNWGVQSAD
jgi:CubicO group peptidase (beta-lactamase class C family)